MLKRPPLLFFCLIFTTLLYAQQDFSENELQNIADDLYESKRYNKALEYYRQLEEEYGIESAEYRYKIAISYLNTNVDKTQSIQYLDKIEKDDLSDEENFYYAYGKAYHFNYEFDKAITHFEKFLEEANNNDERRDEVKRRIEMCKNGKSLIKDSVNVTISNLGDQVNTKYPEYTPVISSDEKNLIFTSRRKGCVGGLQRKPNQPDELYGIYFEDVFYSKNKQSEWTAPEGISNINTTVHDAAIALSPDGNKLFVYRSDSVKYGNIFVCDREEEGWSAPQKMPSPINTKYWEGSASITPNGKVLYFASNRPGGQGKRDIYKIKKKSSGEWGESQNLRPTINTPYQDAPPFIRPDKQTLYFSSKGHNSMGGYDIFKTQQQDTSWTTPINIGYPINTTDQDIYFVISGDGQHGYYASARDDSYGNLDLYQMDLPERAKPQRVIVVNGRIINTDSVTPISSQLTVNTLQENDVVKREKNVEYDANTGEFTLFLNPKEKYTIKGTAPDYESDRDTITTTPADKQIPFQWLVLKKPVKEKEATATKKATVEKDTASPAPSPEPSSATKGKVFMVRYYAFDKATLSDKDKQQLNNLTQLLKEYSSLKVEIGGHTDAIGTDRYNEELGKARARVVSDYLKQQGINEERLSTAWYGENKPFAPNVLPHGVDNPKGRQLNRRSEIIIKGPTSTLNQISASELEIPEINQYKNLLDESTTATNVTYKVQLAAYLDKLPEQYYKVFDNIDKVPTSQDQLKKFLIGSFSTYDEASKIKKMVRQMGIEGAFVVPYQNNERIPIDKALAKTQ